jgi:hypothetical protein
MSASQLLYGTPAKAAVPPYAGLVTLANVAGVAQFTLSTPFPVSANTIVFATWAGFPDVPVGTLYVDRTFAVLPGSNGSVVIKSTGGVGDVGNTVFVQVWNAAAEGF